MYSYQNNKLGLRIVICCVVIVMATVSPARAVDRSRLLTIGLFASGVGLKFGSAIVASSAQDTYDQYLSTGLQRDIIKHRDDYQSQHNLSLGLGRTGMGFVGLAVLVSIFDQFAYISESSDFRSGKLSLKSSYNPQKREAALIVQRNF